MNHPCHLAIRAGLLFALLGAFASAGADDVTWLADVRKAPSVVPREGIGPLAPLLVDDRGKAIETRQAWEAHRPRVRARWVEFLGKMPDPRPAVKLEVKKTEKIDGIVRELVRYEGEPGLYVEGYLLRPDESSRGKRPALVGLHPTTSSSIDEIAGVSGPPEKQTGLMFAQRGFVVFCPRCFLWQDAASYDEAVAAHRRRHPGTLGMAKMLYDAMRGVDVLESLEMVDARRIGAFGHSLGAKETLYLAAFDERIKAAAASEGGLGLRSTNWNAPWYLGEKIRDDDFSLNHHELLALLAPRPFLVLGGEQGPGAADGNRSWPLLEAALPVWKLYGEPTRLGLLNHGRGHALKPEEFARVAEWLETYLK